MSLSAFLVYIAILLCWGVSPLFDKAILAQVPSRLLFVARFYLIFILMLAPMVLKFDEIRLALFQTDRRLVWYLVASVLMPMTGLMLYYDLLGTADASKVVPLCAAYPLITAVLGVAALKEPFTAAKLAGTVMIVGGAYLLARS